MGSYFPSKEARISSKINNRFSELRYMIMKPCAVRNMDDDTTNLGIHKSHSIFQIVHESDYFYSVNTAKEFLKVSQDFSHN